jgi:hypothetical protein
MLTRKSAVTITAASGLLWLLFAAPALSQDLEIAPSPEPPNLEALQTNWWSYFEGSRAEVEPRAAGFLASLDESVADLAPQNAANAATLVTAIRDNVTAYLSLLDDPVLEIQKLPEAAVEYSIDELLQLAANARDAAETTREEQLEVEREARILEGASRRRDIIFDDYVGATAGDDRLLATLRLIQARSEQAI